jgi:hypothetical protein
MCLSSTPTLNSLPYLHPLAQENALLHMCTRNPYIDTHTHTKHKHTQTHTSACHKYQHTGAPPPHARPQSHYSSGPSSANATPLSPPPPAVAAAAPPPHAPPPSVTPSGPLAAPPPHMVGPSSCYWSIPVSFQLGRLFSNLGLR